VLEAKFVSLRPLFSKPPDFAKTVRIFKWLICQRYSAQDIRTFRIPLEAREELGRTVVLKLLRISESQVRHLISVGRHSDDAAIKQMIADNQVTSDQARTSTRR
jgi:hypothetical protein